MTYLVEVKSIVLLDLRPMLKIPGAALFSVTREVLRCASHLGQLYTGEVDARGGCETFLNHFMSKADIGYRLRAEEICRMHFDGAALRFEPRILKNKAHHHLEWFGYVGSRATSLALSGLVPLDVRHLTPTEMDRHWYLLPVSTPCLLDDLVSAIESFRDSGPDSARIGSWNQAIDRLGSGSEFDFVP